MEKIIELPEVLVNKIAAGEVVERPASIVKELVDNAIDAGATSIYIDIKEGGKKEISVRDNGCGIPRDYMELAVKSHSTSKISSFDDLLNAKTLGFRGEALSSISSVSSLRIESRYKNEDIGTMIWYMGGKPKERSDSPIPEGTLVSVSNIFYNVPARRKYMKSVSTEYNHILKLVQEYAIINPDIALVLVSDGKEILRLPKSEKLIERISRIFGRDIADNVIRVKASEGNYRLNGYISIPSGCRKDNSVQVMSINGRLASEQIAVKFIYEAYRKYIMKNLHPVYFLDIEVPPRDIDINIHPRKTYVRFRDEEKISDFLFRSIRVTLYNNLEIPDVKYNDLKNYVSAGEKEHTTNANVSSSMEKTMIESIDKVRVPTISATGKQSRLDVKTDKEVEPTPIKSTNFIGDIKPVMQFLKTYIIAVSDDELFIIDQHAAAERITYEHLLSSFDKKTEYQDLLDPIRVDLNPSDALKFEKAKDKLQKLGFRFSSFGGNSILIEGIPSAVRSITKESFMNILHDTSISMGKDFPENMDYTIKTIACHTSIRAGASLDINNMQRLINELNFISNPLMCPHGRPTIIRFSRKELEKMFRRVI